MFQSRTLLAPRTVQLGSSGSFLFNTASYIAGCPGRVGESDRRCRWERTRERASFVVRSNRPSLPPVLHHPPTLSRPLSSDMELLRPAFRRPTVDPNSPQEKRKRKRNNPSLQEKIPQWIGSLFGIFGFWAVLWALKHLSIYPIRLLRPREDNIADRSARYNRSLRQKKTPTVEQGRELATNKNDRKSGSLKSVCVSTPVTTSGRTTNSCYEKD